ncbi:CbiX/SirB N-terminal domain-containing protein [Myceligenerans pegani]|uniref:Sirohydrochlorin chelatase n=1 Tax=Myceligenerans pegani TaxID=2776917 RepID=A0ABR9N4F5_9MICO|nr:sirohydrochlorin chelatase [Myceligenerans sp. TRM 65318]MBE3020229.1 sirohydrochlorin chelatase [Myceligenerans sp. TRM 65318]
MAPVLVGTSHGTDDAAGQAAVRALLDGVRAARPDLDVREAFVDVQTPEVDDVLAGAVADAGSAVVVPLLLSTGYHVRHDIARAVAAHDDAAVSAEPLGPDPRLVDLLTDRLAEIDESSGLRPDDAVVLAAAGSSVAAAAVAVEEVAAGLAERLGRPVTPSYGAGAEPRVPAAVAAVRAGSTGDGGGGEGEAVVAGTTPAEGDAGVPGRVVVASYLLAPGYFHDRVLEAGADVVTAPLAPSGTPDDRLVRIVLDRYEAAADRLALRRSS